MTISKHLGFALAALVIIGLAQSNGLFAEATLGALESPTFKFAVGYTFHP